MRKNKGLSKSISPDLLKAQLDLAKEELKKKMLCHHEDLVYIEHKYLHAWCPSCQREFIIRSFDVESE